MDIFNSSSCDPIYCKQCSREIVRNTKISEACDCCGSLDHEILDCDCEDYCYDDDYDDYDDDYDDDDDNYDEDYDAAE